MSFDYTDLRDTAVELITEFGRTLTLRSSDSADVYDEIEGTWTAGPGAVTDVEFFGVTLNPTMEYTQAVGAGNVQARDMLIYMEPTVEPKMTGAIVIDGEVWQVVNVQRIQPSTTVLLYIVQVRP